jgi:hypothetical protein
MRLWGKEVKDMSLEESYHVYQGLYEDQQEIIYTGEDVKTFRLGLLSLPNVRRVTLTSEAWRPTNAFPLYETPFFRSLPPGLQMPILWPWLGRHQTREFSEADEDDLMASWEHGPHNEWCGYDIVVNGLLNTAGHHHVREFVIEVNREPTRICYQLFEAPLNPRRNLSFCDTVILFESTPLTRLDLAINVETADLNDFSCFHNARLQTALSKLTSLEHFHLHVNMPTDEPEFAEYVIGDDLWIDLKNVFPSDLNTTWNNLKHFGLANFFTTPDSMYSVLSSLPSLETIDLDTLIFPQESGQYHSLLHQLKENLVDAEGGAWKARKPQITIRVINEDELRTRRVTITREVSKFFYQDGDFPFLETDPGVIAPGFGFILDDFDPDYEKPHLHL